MATRSHAKTDGSSFRTIRSFPSSKAMAPVPTSGGRACASSTAPSRRPTAASGRSRGWKSLPARRATSSSNNWLPDDTVEAFREYFVGIKGPLTTPVGGGIRSLNVALRQMLDLYVCLRPVRWYKGVPSPVKHPEKVDMVIFRENTEDIYAGIEYAAGSPEAQKLLEFLSQGVSRRSSRRSASAPNPPPGRGRRSSNRLARRIAILASRSASD